MDKKERIRLFYHYVVGVLEATHTSDSEMLKIIVEEIDAIKGMKEED